MANSTNTIKIKTVAGVSDLALNSTGNFGPLKNTIATPGVGSIAYRLKIDDNGKPIYQYWHPQGDACKLAQMKSYYAMLRKNRSKWEDVTDWRDLQDLSSEVHQLFRRKVTEISEMTPGNLSKNYPLDFVASIREGSFGDTFKYNLANTCRQWGQGMHGVLAGKSVSSGMTQWITELSGNNTGYRYDTEMDFEHNMELVYDGIIDTFLGNQGESPAYFINRSVINYYIRRFKQRRTPKVCFVHDSVKFVL